MGVHRFGNEYRFDIEDGWSYRDEGYQAEEAEALFGLSMQIDNAMAAIERRDRKLNTMADAIVRLLMSSDASWEELNLGHDWRDAMEHAREVLGIHPGGL